MYIGPPRIPARTALMLLLAQLAAIAAPVPMCYTWPEWPFFSKDVAYRLDQMEEANVLPSHCCQTCYNGLLMPTWYYTEIDSTGSVLDDSYFFSGDGAWVVETEEISSGSLLLEAKSVCNICVSKTYCEGLNMIVNEWHHTCTVPSEVVGLFLWRKHRRSDEAKARAALRPVSY